VIERWMAELGALDHVTEAMLLERDGFVLSTTEHEAYGSSLPVNHWIELANAARPGDVITLVLEDGYALISTVSLGILVVICEKQCNLGRLRTVITSIRTRMLS